MELVPRLTFPGRSADRSRPQGTLLRASQFLAAELPIRLAHRVKELDELPQGLHKMPSIEKVKRWYAQSFEVSCRPSSARTRTETGSLTIFAPRAGTR